MFRNLWRPHQGHKVIAKFSMSIFDFNLQHTHATLNIFTINYHFCLLWLLVVIALWRHLSIIASTKLSRIPPNSWQTNWLNTVWYKAYCSYRYGVLYYIKCCLFHQIANYGISYLPKIP